MIERIWNPAAGRSFDDFNHRLAATDRLLDPLVRQAGQAAPEKVKYTSFEGERVERYAWLGQHVAFQTVRADLDPAVMRRLCDTFDKVYEFYSDATGASRSAPGSTKAE